MWGGGPVLAQPLHAQPQVAFGRPPTGPPVARQQQQQQHAFGRGGGGFSGGLLLTPREGGGAAGAGGGGAGVGGSSAILKNPAAGSPSTLSVNGSAPQSFNQSMGGSFVRVGGNSSVGRGASTASFGRGGHPPGASVGRGAAVGDGDMRGGAAGRGGRGAGTALSGNPFAPVRGAATFLRAPTNAQQPGPSTVEIPASRGRGGHERSRGGGWFTAPPSNQQQQQQRQQLPPPSSSSKPRVGPEGVQGHGAANNTGAPSAAPRTAVGKAPMGVFGALGKSTAPVNRFNPTLQPRSQEQQQQQQLREGITGSSQLASGVKPMAPNQSQRSQSDSIAVEKTQTGAFSAPGKSSQPARRFNPPAPAHSHHQEQQKQQQMIVSTSTNLASVKPTLYVANCFKEFVIAMLRGDHTLAVRVVDTAAFHKSSQLQDDDIPRAIKEMQLCLDAACQQRPDCACGRSWIVILAMCASANAIDALVVEGCDADWYALLKSACERMNIATKALAEMKQEGNPLSHHALFEGVLRRHRITFDRADTLRVNDVASNAGLQCMHIFRNMPRALRDLNPAQRAQQTPEEQQAVVTVAYLLVEILSSTMAETVLKGAQKNFLLSFPQYYSDHVDVCVALLYRLGRLSIRLGALDAARHQVASAFQLCPNDEGHAHNRRLIFITLATLGLANGEIPDDALLAEFPVPELMDFVFAMRTGSIGLFDAALGEHSAFFLERGVLSALRVSRTFVMLQLMIKFFLSNGRQRQIELKQLKKYVEEDLGRVSNVGFDQVLPLLLHRQKLLMGAIQGEYLVLSTTPFPLFPDLKSS